MMKKVEIITRHAVGNYGSLMQSYASIKLFEQLGYDAEIIDYLSSNEKPIRLLNDYAVYNRKLHGLKKLAYIVLKYPVEKKKTRIFSKMRKKYLKMSKRYWSADKMKSKFDNAILCSGGDQLWGYMPNNQLDDAYYLSFANNTNKLISLSSSFGRYDFTDEEINRISNNLSRYDFITVRESSAVEFINKFSIESKQILDPTLLLKRESWIELCDKKAKFDKPYVLVYKLRQDNKLNELAEALAKKYNLEVYFISNTSFNKVDGHKTFVNKKLDFVLSLFNNCSFVVTDSFHATVMSTIFNKQFFVHLPGLTNSRIVDYLDMINHKERIYEATNDIEGLTSKEIDYKQVNAILDEKREQSVSYFKEMLERL